MVVSYRVAQIFRVEVGAVWSTLALLEPSLVRGTLVSFCESRSFEGDSLAVKLHTARDWRQRERAAFAERILGSDFAFNDLRLGPVPGVELTHRSERTLEYRATGPQGASRYVGHRDIQPVGGSTVAPLRMDARDLRFGGESEMILKAYSTRIAPGSIELIGSLPDASNVLAAIEQSTWDEVPTPGRGTT